MQRNYLSHFFNRKEKPVTSLPQGAGEKIGSGWSSNIHVGNAEKPSLAFKINKIRQKVHGNSYLDLTKFYENEKAILQKISQSPSSDYAKNIIGYFGSFTVPVRYHLLEYANGGCLSDWLNNNDPAHAPFPWCPNTTFPWCPSGNSIATDMAQGLSYLHSLNIIYNNLHPDNVLIFSSENGDIHAKLAGFSLAKTSDDNMTCSYGAPSYMSPERWLGGPVTIKSDVYSFGICLNEIINKKPPFHKYNEITSDGIYNLVVILEENDEIAANCPEKIAHLIRLSWMKNPAERPDANTFITELEEDKKDNMRPKV